MTKSRLMLFKASFKHGKEKALSINKHRVSPLSKSALNYFTVIVRYFVRVYQERRELPISYEQSVGRRMSAFHNRLTTYIH
jgi:hypothetical protein